MNLTTVHVKCSKGRFCLNCTAWYGSGLWAVDIGSCLLSINVWKISEKEINYRVYCQPCTDSKSCAACFVWKCEKSKCIKNSKFTKWLKMSKVTRFDIQMTHMVCSEVYPLYVYDILVVTKRPSLDRPMQDFKKECDFLFVNGLIWDWEKK